MIKAIIIIFISGFIAVSSIEASELRYERLSDKLLGAQKRMSKAYKHTGKFLSPLDKKEYRAKQYTWKLNKKKICLNRKLSEKKQTLCQYKKTQSRITYLKTYIPSSKKIVQTLTYDISKSIKPTNVYKASPLA